MEIDFQSAKFTVDIKDSKVGTGMHTQVRNLQGDTSRGYIVMKSIWKSISAILQAHGHPRVAAAECKRLVVLFAFTFLTITNAAFAQRGLQPDVAHPAVIATGAGKLEVFVRGMNNDLVQRSWNGWYGLGWSGWKNLGGDLTAAPAVTSSQSGRLDVFVRGEDGHLVHKIFQDGQWSKVWDNLGGDLTSAPAAVSPAPGRIDVFVRGLNGDLVQRTYNNGIWGGWINLGRDLTSAPAAVITAPNRIEVFYRDRNLHLVQGSFNGSTWSWQNLGGNLTAAPAAAASWSWQNPGGNLTAAPAAAASGPAALHVFVRGPDGELRQRSWNGSAWSNWKNLGFYLTSAPAVAATSDSGLEVFIRGPGDGLWQRSFHGGTWSEWKDVGGDLRGKLRARLKLLTHNVYGLSGPNHGFPVASHVSVCAFRAKEFGRRVANAASPYDIVGIQEYYDTPDLDWATCDSNHLSNAIWSTGRYRNSNNYYRFRPKVGGWQVNGGIGVFTLHPIVSFGAWQWDNDAQPWIQAAEGFIFARIGLFPGISVDTYIVHLNSGGENRERRKGQLRQLAREIARSSRNSGNPVIVMGDFNIGGPPSYFGNDGYGDIMDILKYPQDLWMAAHPENNGITYDCFKNKLATGCASRERIDYIFVVTDPAFTNSPYLVKLDKKYDTTTVDWRVEVQFPVNLGFAHVVYRKEYNVSDHFGVETVIEIRDK